VMTEIDTVTTEIADLPHAQSRQTGIWIIVDQIVIVDHRQITIPISI